MQAILEKLSDTSLTKEEIYKITSNTKRHDTLLQVMKTYPENTELIEILIEKNCTVTDYEYAKKHLPQHVDFMEKILFKKYISVFEDDISEINLCYGIRSIYGPYHRVTQSVEHDIIPSYRDAFDEYRVTMSCENFVWDVYDYRCGTIEGAREVIDEMSEWLRATNIYCFYTKQKGVCTSWGYDCGNCYLRRGIDDGDMLDYAILYGFRCKDGREEYSSRADHVHDYDVSDDEHVSDDEPISDSDADSDDDPESEPLYKYRYYGYYGYGGAKEDARERNVERAKIRERNVERAKIRDTIVCEVDLDFIYNIANRVDPENLHDALCIAIRKLPKEHKLHCIIAEKQVEDIAECISVAEEICPDNTELLEILKKKL